MRHRVVITGTGAVTPIGVGTDAFVDALLAGTSGVGPITLFDPASLQTRIAAEVDWSGPTIRDRKVTFALEAAAQAVAAATVDGARPRGVGGVSFGLGLELFSMDDMVAFRLGHRTPGASLEERLTFIQTPSDLCVHMIATRYGLTAPPLTHVSACAAGTDAIGAAFRLVASGRRRWVLAGGTDSMINPLGVGGFCKLGALSTRNDEPAQASRPFDRTRDGFVLGEGAGALVLERLEDAHARGATLHAEVLGYGNSFDAHGISEPHPEGRGAQQAMARALDEAGLAPTEVDVINAHGTSTPKNDPVETAAIRGVFGEHADRLRVCATKSMIGHLISAAGAVEAIAAIGCLERGKVHATINLDDPDPQCDLDYVAGDARDEDGRVAISNSFGFGGQNASIVLRRLGDADG